MAVWCPYCGVSVTAERKDYYKPTEVTEFRPRFTSKGLQSVETGTRTKWTEETRYICSMCKEELPDLGAATYEDYKRRKSGRFRATIVMIPVGVTLFFSCMVSFTSVFLCWATGLGSIWLANAIIKPILMKKPKVVWIVLSVGTIVPMILAAIFHRPYSYDSESSSHKTSPEEQVNTPEPTQEEEVYNLCGGEADNSAFVYPPNWEEYSCKDEFDVPDSVWYQCLSRKVYALKAGSGCPGESKCCPPSQ
jgi:hypothetical protein